jgi:hypothetical protein
MTLPRFLWRLMQYIPRRMVPLTYWKTNGTLFVCQ